MNASTANKQTGVVLLLCLIFLTALTLLGLSASADTILQNNLTANLQETERAKQTALTTLSWAEKWLLELDSPPPAHCTEPCAGLYLHAPEELPPRPEFESISWWLANGHEAGIDPLTGNRLTSITNGSIDAPVWMIEVLHAVPASENGTTDLQVWYRILARGSGHTHAGVSVIESTVVRSWPSIEGTETSAINESASCPGSEPAALCGRVSWRELR